MWVHGCRRCEAIGEMGGQERIVDVRETVGGGWDRRLWRDGHDGEPETMVHDEGRVEDTACVYGERCEVGGERDGGRGEREISKRRQGWETGT